MRKDTHPLTHTHSPTHTHTAPTAYLLGKISDQWEVQGTTETTGLSGSLGPGQVRELAVDTGANQLGSGLADTSSSSVELEDLSRAHERKVQWVEEQHDVLAGKVRQRNVLKVTADKSRGSEGRGGLSNTSRHYGDDRNGGGRQTTTKERTTVGKTRCGGKEGDNEKKADQSNGRVFIRAKAMASPKTPNNAGERRGTLVFVEHLFFG
jgi:hypothetical protein